MGIVAPPSKGRDTTNNSKNEKNYLSQCAASKLKETLCTADGRQMSVAQGIVERLASIAIFAEAHTDAISAAKTLRDWVEGKSGIIKDDTVKDIPKVMIRLNNYQAEKIENLANEEEPEDDTDPESLVMAEINGKTYLG